MPPSFYQQKEINTMKFSMLTWVCKAFRRNMKKRENLEMQSSFEFAFDGFITENSGPDQTKRGYDR